VQSTNTDTPKSSTSATFGLSIRDESTLYGLDGLTQAGAKVTYGQLKINDTAAASIDAAGAQTQGNYSKVVADVSRVSLLPQKFSLTTALRIQQSLGNKNLDGSERMAVSGSGAVLAYPSGELIGSDATFVRAELARPLPSAGKLRSNWLLFADWGTAKQPDPLPTDVKRNINDVGLGWSANYGGALIHAYLAHRMSSAAVSEPYPDNNLLVQAGWVF
jgi:hemolysin activation/secretion protein